jgi:hypothetical protein
VESMSLPESPKSDTGVEPVRGRLLDGRKEVLVVEYTEICTPSIPNHNSFRFFYTLVHQPVLSHGLEFLKDILLIYLINKKLLILKCMFFCLFSTK